MSCTDSCLIGSDTWLPGSQSSSVSSTVSTSPWASNRALRNAAVSMSWRREMCGNFRPPAPQGTDSGCFSSLLFPRYMFDRTLAEWSQVSWVSVSRGHCDAGTAANSKNMEAQIRCLIILKQKDLSSLEVTETSPSCMLFSWREIIALLCNVAQKCLLSRFYSLNSPHR